MKKMILCALAALSLGACTATGGTTSITITSVEQAAVNSCKFLPTAETVSSLIAAAVPGLSTVQALADAICAAVAPKSSGMAAAQPSIGGVAIKGTFVK